MSSRKGISVKIATPKVIKALQASLAKLEFDYASQEISEAKFEKAFEKHKKELVAYAIANIKKAENFRTSFRSWNGTLNIDFDLTGLSESDVPQSPERDYTTISRGEYNSQKQELENAIRILKMTDEEVVNASTFKSIAQYL